MVVGELMQQLQEAIDTGMVSINDDVVVIGTGAKQSVFPWKVVVPKLLLKEEAVDRMLDTSNGYYLIGFSKVGVE